jgi:hypothetical protein
MITSHWFLAGAGVVVTAFGGWLSFRYVRITEAREKDRALRHMERHPALNETQFGQRYFPSEEAEIAARVRGILAAHIRPSRGRRSTALFADGWRHMISLVN